MEIPISFSCPCGSWDTIVLHLWVYSKDYRIKVETLCAQCKQVSVNRFDPKEMVKLYNENISQSHEKN